MRLISLGILLGSTLGLVAVTGCTSGGDDTDGEGGDNGSGGDDGGGDGGGSGNTTGDGGTSGSGGGGGGDPDAVACLPVTQALILDFTYDAAADPPQSTTDGEFGDYTATFSGGTFKYPEALTSDVTDSNWHLAGELDTYGGFALFLANDCTKIDASAYSGVKFTISGDTEGKAVVLNVGTAANEVSSAWREGNGETDVTPNFGRCEPVDNPYDGTCVTPTFSVVPTAEPTVIEVSWADLTGGSPEDVNPAEITFIGWNFTPPEGVDTAGVVPYAVDIVVDDIAFIE